VFFALSIEKSEIGRREKNQNSKRIKAMTSAPSPSSSSSSYEVDSAALLKILLHAAKHPSSDVLGVLLGRPPKGSDAIDADASSTPTPSVSGRVVDALPLFHGPMLHGPMLEVALLQVRRRKERKRERESKGEGRGRKLVCNFD